MAGRKIGVGFNQPRVLNIERSPPSRAWNWARKLTRLPRNPKSHLDKPWSSSTIETRRIMVADAMTASQ